MRIAMLAAIACGLGYIPFAAHAAPCDGFADVDSASTYCPALTFVKSKGVTLGCGDGSNYCPNDYVTRLQMALFMQRMARGGPHNLLADATSSIGGGDSNATPNANSFATVGGGILNNASGLRAVVGGGTGNLAAGGNSTVAGGYQNSALGEQSTIPGGRFNLAEGDDSFAAGVHADADQLRCAVFSLWSTDTGITCIGSPYIFRIGSNHGFSVDYYSQRDDGGGTRWVLIGDGFAGQTITSWNGAYLSDGGTWTNSSDRNAKTDVMEVNPLDILDKVVAMPVSTWRYKAEADQLHLGPMAQDFHAAFGLGADDRHIATVDEGGVALAAIKALNQKLEATRDELDATRGDLDATRGELDARAARITEMALGNAELRQRNEALERRLDAVERAIAR